MLRPNCFAAAITESITGQESGSSDNQKVVVPNNMIWGNIITNITGTSKRRVDMVFGIGYGEDIAKAQKILEDILVNHDAVLKDPESVVKVQQSFRF